MTSPVCPACRSAVTLTTTVCSSCGLAVRPTCATCGEPLRVGDVVCPSCLESIDLKTKRRDARPILPPTPVHPPIAAPPAADAPLVLEPAPGTKQIWRRSTIAYVATVAIVSGVIVAGALLALQLIGPGLSSKDVPLEPQSFAKFGFSISSPVGWGTQIRAIDRQPAVTFFDSTKPSAGQPQQGFRVVVDTVTLPVAQRDVEKIVRRTHPASRKITSRTATVDARRAFEYVYADGVLSYDVWYVERRGGTYRIEFWAAANKQDEASSLRSRVLLTFKPR